MSDTKRYINYDVFESRASELEAKNKILREDLDEIKKLINQTDSTWISEAAEEIRSKINGMEPRFDSYRDVVDNYVKFIRNTGEQYRTVEKTNKNLASEFI